jgi:hypothetical protein
MVLILVAVLVIDDDDHKVGGSGGDGGDSGGGGSGDDVNDEDDDNHEGCYGCGCNDFGGDNNILMILLCEVFILCFVISNHSNSFVISNHSNTSFFYPRRFQILVSAHSF